jgi:hypothetical protein
MVRPARSLSATITLYLGGGLLALGIGLGLALTWGIGAWLDRAVRAQTQTLATQLATVSLDAVLISDYGTLERYLLDLATQPGIRALRIQRADGEILGEAGAPPDVRSPTGVVWAQAPVQLGASRIGEVLVGYDASATHRTLRDIGLTWTAGLLIASGALYLGLRRTLQRQLVEPVEQLAARLCDFAETGEIERDGLPRAAGARGADVRGLVPTTGRVGTPAGGGRAVGARRDRAPVSGAASMNGRYTLLIAEDDRRMAALLAELAESAGFRPQLAADGASAAAVLERGEADGSPICACRPPMDSPCCAWRAIARRTCRPSSSPGMPPSRSRSRPFAAGSSI